MKNSRKKDYFDKLSKKEIERVFSFMIRGDMTNEEFKDWQYGWFDPSTVIDIAEEWYVEDKREELRDFYKSKLSRFKKLLNEFKKEI